MQGVLSSGARGSVILCKSICHLMQVVLSSGARGSVISRKGFYPFHARGSVSGVDLMQGVLASHARGSGIRVGEVMQEVLSSGARGSVIRARPYARGSVSCKGFYVHLTQEVLSPEQLTQEVLCPSHARVSVMQGVLCPISCKSICLMQGVLSLNKVLLTQ